MGFAIDEPKEYLGEHLMLPRHDESQRAAMKRMLRPPTLPGARAKAAR